jgi:hypothetical protein
MGKRTPRRQIRGQKIKEIEQRLNIPKTDILRGQSTILFYDSSILSE